MVGLAVLSIVDGATFKAQILIEATAKFLDHHPVGIRTLKNTRRLADQFLDGVAGLESESRIGVDDARARRV